MSPRQPIGIDRIAALAKIGISSGESRLGARLLQLEPAATSGADQT